MALSMNFLRRSCLSSSISSSLVPSLVAPPAPLVTSSVPSLVASSSQTPLYRSFNSRSRRSWDDDGGAPKREWNNDKKSPRREWSNNRGSPKSRGGFRNSENRPRRRDQGSSGSSDFISNFFDNLKADEEVDETIFNSLANTEAPKSGVKFEDLPLNSKLQEVLAQDGYVEPTPIQAAVVAPALEGKDIVGLSLTGSGKTLAFALPVVQKRINDMKTNPHKVSSYGPASVRALVIAPTRELALQIRQVFRNLKIGTALAVGGQSAMHQIPEIRKCPILVGTPGRLVDFLEQGVIDFSECHQLVLDEADRMLDMGFQRELEGISSALPSDRQTMLFSATLPHEVRGLVKKYTKEDTMHVDVREDQATVSSVEQWKIPTRSFVEKNAKLFRLLEDVEKNTPEMRLLLFCNTKRLVDDTAEALIRAGNKKVQPIHGDLSFVARQRGLARFRTGEAKVLIATDVVARGIDVKGITHVVNYDMPRDTDTYVHRIGRTARAGASGVAVSFVNSREDTATLKKLEYQLGKRLQEMEVKNWDLHKGLGQRGPPKKVEQNLDASFYS